MDNGRLNVGNSSGRIDVARNTDSSGTLIIGDEDGKAPAAPGTVEADGITFGDGDGALVFNHTGSGYVFAPDITGHGAISVLAGDTNLTGDASGFTSTTTVSGGTLRVNDTLGGALDVMDGGVLGGAGTVGATMVHSGGILSPGNSPGTLTIDGDLTLDAGAIYEVEFGDLIVVTGDATLGGEVRVVDGAWQPLIDYTILTATGFVGTEFDSVSSGFTFLDPALRYTDTDVILRLERNDVSFASTAATPNQRAVAGGLDGLSFGNALHDAIVRLDAAGARNAFRQLSGDVHGSAAATRINESGNLRTIVSRRFQSAFDDRRAQTRFPLTSYASLSGAGDHHAHTSNHGVWGQAFGSWGRIGGDGNAAGLRHDQGGFLAGIDTMPADDWRAGMFAGYSRSTFSVSDRASSGSSDNFHLGFHGGTEIGALRLNAGAAHTWHDISTRRSVAFAGFADNLRASYRGRTMQVFGEAGYRFGTDAFSFEPFLGAAHVHTSTNRFTETGGAAALTAQRATTATTFSTLGLRASSEFSLGAMDVTARAMIGWRHAFGDTTPVTRVSFAGGDAFTVTGTQMDRDVAVIETGLDLRVSDRMQFGLSYDGELGKATSRHGFQARLQAAF